MHGQKKKLSRAERKALERIKQMIHQNSLGPYSFSMVSVKKEWFFASALLSGEDMPLILYAAQYHRLEKLWAAAENSKIVFEPIDLLRHQYFGRPIIMTMLDYATTGELLTAMDFAKINEAKHRSRGDEGSKNIEFDAQDTSVRLIAKLLGYEGEKPFREAFFKRDTKGKTFLHHIAHNGDIDLASIMLSDAGDPLKFSDLMIGDDRGITPFEVAVEAGFSRQILNMRLDGHDSFPVPLVIELIHKNTGVSSGLAQAATRFVHETHVLKTRSLRVVDPKWSNQPGS